MTVTSILPLSARRSIFSMNKYLNLSHKSSYFLLVLILGIFILLSWSGTNSTEYEAKSYSPSQLEELIKEKEKYVVIDVRTRKEFDKGHIPGAVHADYYDTEALKKAANGKTPITYCSFSAMRGPYAAYQLYRHGYKDAAVLDGGISGWAEDIKGMESEKSKKTSIFMHPKNIFPERKNDDYPVNAGSVEFNLTAEKFRFNPSIITVKHGQKVTLNLKSLDVTHGFSLPEFGVEAEILPGELKSVSFIATRKGNYPFICNVICGAAHNHASMIGNLIVE